MGQSSLMSLEIQTCIYSSLQLTSVSGTFCFYFRHNSLVLTYSIVCNFPLQLESATVTLKEQEAKLKETEDEHSSDLENSLIRLEEEQQR